MSENSKLNRQNADLADQAEGRAAARAHTIKAASSGKTTGGAGVPTNPGGDAGKAQSEKAAKAVKALRG